jgi:hypothetical protein
MPPNPQNLRPPFPKGVSGNPKGRPRKNISESQIDDLLNLVDETPDGERLVSKAWFKQILKGSYPHLREYLERRDGKVPTPVEAIETPTVDWSELNVDRDTERPKAANSNRPESVSESGIAEL